MGPHPSTDLLAQQYEMNLSYPLKKNNKLGSVSKLISIRNQGRALAKKNITSFFLEGMASAMIAPWVNPDKDKIMIVKGNDSITYFMKKICLLEFL